MQHFSYAFNMLNVYQESVFIINLLGNACSFLLRRFSILNDARWIIRPEHRSMGCLRGLLIYELHKIVY